MKKTFLLSALLITVLISSAQFFQGSFMIDAAYSASLKIDFKMRPTQQITRNIGYMEAAFRYPTASTASFSIPTITANTTAFPGLQVQRLTPDYTLDGFTYCRFVFNTGVINPINFAAGTEYMLFSITTTLPSGTIPAFEMISNLVTANYQFGVVDGQAVLFNPAANDQLYGPGFYRNGNDHILPLAMGVLPVTFLDFTLSRDGNDALLNWKVANQDDLTSYYEIERSTNGQNFSAIKRIAASRTPDNTASYNGRDLDIDKLEAPVLFYRIKQVDADGRFVYSPIRSVRLAAKGFESILYPNPAVNQARLSFHLKTAERVEITMFDITGRVMERKVITGVKGFNVYTFNTSGLAAGTYKIMLHTDDTAETLKLLKTR